MSLWHKKVRLNPEFDFDDGSIEGRLANARVVLVIDGMDTNNGNPLYLAMAGDIETRWFPKEAFIVVKPDSQTFMPVLIEAVTAEDVKANRIYYLHRGVFKLVSWIWKPREFSYSDFWQVKLGMHWFEDVPAGILYKLMEVKDE